jgi:hypothetical protein
MVNQNRAEERWAIRLFGLNVARFNQPLAGGLPLSPTLIVAGARA